MGIVLNNMGNIHMRNERYDEAIDCYQMSIDRCVTELEKLLEI